MRISTNQVFLNNINNLSNANSALFKTQQQIATGKKVLQPSDDPLASAQIIKLKKEVARTDQFQGNIDVSNRRLALEEITLNQLFTEGIRLKELTIQAGDGVLTQSDQAALAAEVDEIIQQMLGLMNTKDVQGEYIFSGFKGKRALTNMMRPVRSINIRVTVANALFRLGRTTKLPQPMPDKNCLSRLLES